MSTFCKYCGRTELVFDNAYKSKTGRLIPLDKTSGLPHQCTESPYAQQQQQQQQQQQPQQQVQASTTLVTEPTAMKIINAKLDRIIALLLESQQQQSTK